MRVGNILFREMPLARYGLSPTVVMINNFDVIAMSNKDAVFPHTSWATPIRNFESRCISFQKVGDRRVRCGVKAPNTKKLYPRALSFSRGVSRFVTTARLILLGRQRLDVAIVDSRYT
jgi:hypothetical protein